MKPSRFSEEQIIAILKEQDVGVPTETFAAGKVSAIRPCVM